MRSISIPLVLLLGCTGGQHYANIDGGDDDTDGSTPDAYVPDLGALSFAQPVTYRVYFGSMRAARRAAGLPADRP